MHTMSHLKGLAQYMATRKEIIHPPINMFEWYLQDGPFHHPLPDHHGNDIITIRCKEIQFINYETVNG